MCSPVLTPMLQKAIRKPAVTQENARKMTQGCKTCPVLRNLERHFSLSRERLQGEFLIGEVPTMDREIWWVFSKRWDFLVPSQSCLQGSSGSCYERLLLPSRLLFLKFHSTLSKGKLSKMFLSSVWEHWLGTQAESGHHRWGTTSSSVDLQTERWKSGTLRLASASTPCTDTPPPCAACISTRRGEALCTATAAVWLVTHTCARTKCLFNLGTPSSIDWNTDQVKHSL